MVTDEIKEYKNKIDLCNDKVRYCDVVMDYEQYSDM